MKRFNFTVNKPECHCGRLEEVCKGKSAKVLNIKSVDICSNGLVTLTLRTETEFDGIEDVEIYIVPPEARRHE